MEEASARSGGLPLPVRGCPLREGADRWASSEPGCPPRLGRKGRRLQGDPRRGSRRHRACGDLPAAFPFAESQRAKGSEARGLGRARGTEGGYSASLSGSISSEVPCPLCEESARYGGRSEAQGTRLGP